jgi:hypothetical protein
VARYQARGDRGVYWYYKLQATTPIFSKVRVTGKLSRYKHLGASGSQTHVEDVMQVARRVQIDELSATIKALLS